MRTQLHRTVFFFFSTLLSLLFTGNSAAPADELPGEFTATADGEQKVIRNFLDRYCIKCHGNAQQEADRRFDRLADAIDEDSTLVDYQDILDQLNLGAMPPEDARQPTEDERLRVVDWLTQSIESYHASRTSTGGQPILRRLNSREYRNTVRDLLSLNTTIFDPTLQFPMDQTTEHLDNVGATLVTSGALLSRYLMAAETVVDKALFPLQRPPVQTWEFRDDFRQQPEIDQVFRKTNKFAWMTLFDVVGADKHEGAYGPIHAFAAGVPYDGFYEIRLLAEAVNRQHPYDPEFLGLDPDEPLRLGIVAGHRDAGPLHKPQPVEPLLAEMELADEQKWYTVRVWLDAGYTPRMTFRNGLMDARNLWSRIIKKYPDQFPKLKSRGIVEARFTAIHHGKLPQIRIHEIEISGPYFDEWPKPSQTTILGDDFETVAASGELTVSQMREHLHRFATRAYRRPATPAEVDRILQVIQTRQQAGRNPLEAYADGLKVVLCSPHFLYLEPDAPQGCSPAGLASRLSYFLWASMPDEELTDLATSGSLSRPDVLEAQVERMLADPKSAEFLNGFLDSWLTLRDLGSMPPDRDQFREYYHYDLKSAMREETVRFTAHLLEENLPIRNFLDANFTFVNRPLARFYGIDPPPGNGFEKIALTDRRRGGLLGQASVLTVTANGIDTSPVVRGVWLLENILGTPPSPPPPDVEPLDPDIRGAKTIRDQLEKHRESPSCNACHRKIDPPGFALENFDPIGGWRTHYPNRSPIDASGELTGGRSFTNVKEFKSILMEQESLFASMLTRKLLAYAIGRPIEPLDRPEIDAILAEHDRRGGGFRDLVKLVVLSRTFRSAVESNQTVSDRATSARPVPR